MGKKFILAVMATILLAGFSARAQTIKSKKIKHIGWLAGTWVNADSSNPYKESWKWVDDSTIQGVGWKGLSPSDSLVQVSVQLISRHGVIYFIPSRHTQQNGGLSAYLITSLSSSELDAEIEEGGFPQKISYRLYPDGHMEKTLSGQRDGHDAEEIQAFFRHRGPQ
jgi:hypothetical protein